MKIAYINQITLLFFTVMVITTLHSPAIEAFNCRPQHHIWSQGFGDINNDYSYCLDVNNSNEVAISGRFQGSIDLGGVALNSSGDYDIFLAKFTSDGTHIFSYSFGDSLFQTATDLSFDNSGNIILVGGFYGTVDFGGGSLINAAGRDIYLTKLDSSGNHLFSNQYGNSTDQYAWSSAVDQVGDIYMAGRLNGSVDFGGGPLISSGDYDAYFSKFDSSGNHINSMVFGDTAFDSVTDLAIDNSGNIIIVGGYYNNIDFGGGILTSAGGRDIFVAKFDSNGNHVFSERFGDSSNQ